MNGVPTVSRHNIQLTEDALGVGYFRDRPVWRATFDGPLSTGESARVARSGTTAAAAGPPGGGDRGAGLVSRRARVGSKNHSSRGWEE